ncbi:unnamed protein product, partial [Porites evermanni]
MLCSLALCSLVVGKYFPTYKQACYFAHARFKYCVYFCGFGNVILCFRFTILSVQPLLTLLFFGRLIFQTTMAVDDDVNGITNPQSGIGAVDPILDLVNTGPYDQRPQVQFTSVSVPLTSRVSSKIKAKIWANEYINFGSLLSDSPQQEGKYSLSMSPSVAGSSSQP